MITVQELHTNLFRRGTIDSLHWTIFPPIVPLHRAGHRIPNLLSSLFGRRSFMSVKNSLWVSGTTSGLWNPTLRTSCSCYIVHPTN